MRTGVAAVNGFHTCPQQPGPISVVHHCSPTRLLVLLPTLRSSFSSTHQADLPGSPDTLTRHTVASTASSFFSPLPHTLLLSFLLPTVAKPQNSLNLQSALLDSTLSFSYLQSLGLQRGIVDQCPIVLALSLVHPSSRSGQHGNLKNTTTNNSIFSNARG